MPRCVLHSQSENWVSRGFVNPLAQTRGAHPHKKHTHTPCVSHWNGCISRGSASTTQHDVRAHVCTPGVAFNIYMCSIIEDHLLSGDDREPQSNGLNTHTPPRAYVYAFGKHRFAARFEHHHTPPHTIASQQPHQRAHALRSSI